MLRRSCGSSSGFGVRNAGGKVPGAGLLVVAVLAGGAMFPEVSAAGCVAQPHLDCTPAISASASLTHPSIGGIATAKPKMDLRIQLEEIAFTDLQDPTQVGADYQVCLYQLGNLDLDATLPGGMLDVKGKAAWKGKAGKGYSFKDKNGASGGITKADFKAGIDGKASIRVRGDGPNLVLPNLYLAGLPTVIQVVNTASGTCFEVAMNDGTGVREFDVFKSSAALSIEQAVPATCADGIRNQQESEIDCGGPCAACEHRQVCTYGRDCADGLQCVTGTDISEFRRCLKTAPTDVGGVFWMLGLNGASCNTVCSSVGTTCDAVPMNDIVGSGGTLAACAATASALGITVVESIDISGGNGCSASGTSVYREVSNISSCFNSSTNLGEQVCSCAPATAGCSDGVKNGTETDIDCGGESCPQCDAGQACGWIHDCMSNYCDAGVCVRQVVID